MQRSVIGYSELELHAFVTPVRDDFNARVCSKLNFTTNEHKSNSNYCMIVQVK